MSAALGPLLVAMTIAGLASLARAVWLGLEALRPGLDNRRVDGDFVRIRGKAAARDRTLPSAWHGPSLVVLDRRSTDPAAASTTRLAAVPFLLRDEIGDIGVSTARMRPIGNPLLASTTVDADIGGISLDSPEGDGLDTPSPEVDIEELAVIPGATIEVVGRLRSLAPSGDHPYRSGEPSWTLEPPDAVTPIVVVLDPDGHRLRTAVHAGFLALVGLNAIVLAVASLSGLAK
jgi:hypothetical protein